MIRRIVFTFNTTFMYNLDADRRNPNLDPDRREDGHSSGEEIVIKENQTEIDKETSLRLIDQQVDRGNSVRRELDTNFTEDENCSVKIF